MEINELRIGNLVDKGIIFGIGHVDGKQGVYCLKDKFSSISESFYIEDIQPIQLTE